MFPRSTPKLRRTKMKNQKPHCLSESQAPNVALCSIYRCSAFDKRGPFLSKKDLGKVPKPVGEPGLEVRISTLCLDSLAILLILFL